ncbi:uncharacterized protein LOC112262065 isoform X3 [Oncorhynchus tshawytscha]|uniref:uncharacterized protein LOC112262065 isoform X3 n=1 Tax=Oncorhynchus tshawytscha TaxID=74940 RepID=UPI001C3DDD6D|nr:uncharacterized protein LOC112262065 isoform X3 [Oncorhynchus tshawytscha]
MQLLFLLLCLFVKPAFLQESQWAKLIFQIGAPVMPAGSVYAGVAGLVLVLIAGVLLTLLLLWLWRQRAKEKAGQETLATNSAPAKGYTGPAKAPKGKSQAQAGNEGEVYINCGESNQAYSDLYPTYMTGDDTYATLG